MECWYCGGTGGDDLVFSWEFDSLVHRSCLRESGDEEAEIMAEELSE